MDIPFILSLIAIILSIINVLFAVGTSYNKILLYLSLLISFIWCIYGYFDNKTHIFIGYLIIFFVISYIIYYN
jgi:hypothetical protein